MQPTIITDYRKDLRHPPGRGYGVEIRGGVWQRDRAQPPSSIVIHTTSNRHKNTSFHNECVFLRDSPDVSAQDVIGKAGQVAILLPASAQAWHAGTALAEFANSASIGYELHVSVGEHPTAEQIASLTWRVKPAIAKYGIRRERIETHRAIALPRGRKPDPEGWSDRDFYAWRNSLYEPEWPVLWGRANYDAVQHFGIPRLWRDEHRAGRPLGPALTDEQQLSDGRLIQIFRDGAIVWHDGRGEVWR